MTLLEDIQAQTEILPGHPLFDTIHIAKGDNEQLIAELNTGYKNLDQTRELVSRIIGQELDTSVEISLPFQTDFGRHISMGRDIFINKEAFFVDLGGITIEDKVLIGPRVTLITVNHILNPARCHHRGECRRCR